MKNHLAAFFFYFIKPYNLQYGVFLLFIWPFIE